MMGSGLDLSPDQRLALAYTNHDRRIGFAALLALDAMLARAVFSVSEPMLGQIRLSWWREQFEGGHALDASDPVLRGAAHVVRGDDAERLFLRLVNGWERLLTDDLPPPDAAWQHATERGGALFALAALCVGQSSSSEVESAGSLWALVDLARHTSDRSEAQQIWDLATAHRRNAAALPKSIRPFAILARFAERDLDRGFANLIPAGSPRRILDAWSLILSFK